MSVNTTWMTNSFVLAVICIAAFILGAYMAWTWFRVEIQVLKARQKADKWETPKDFKERTGSSLPLEAAVYCRWKKDGPMYMKLKELYANNIAADPDVWAVHTHFTALSIGDVHGEQMEILCADGDMGYPPPHAEVWRLKEKRDAVF